MNIQMYGRSTKKMDRQLLNNFALYNDLPISPHIAIKFLKKCLKILGVMNIQTYGHLHDEHENGEKRSGQFCTMNFLSRIV